MKGKNLVVLVMLTLLSACVQTSGGGNSKKYQDNDSQAEPENSPAMLNVKMGVAYFERNDLDTALEKFKRALAHNPKLAIAHSAIATVYSSMNAEVDAKRHYKLSVKYAPNDPVILNNYGTFLCRTGEYLDAVKYYQKTLANPFYKTPETVHENIGVCLMKADEYAEAEKHFRRALANNPNLTVSLYNMVIVTAGKGESMKARAFIQRLEGLTTLDEKVLKVAYEVEKKMGNERAANQYLAQIRKLNKS
ncbi:MAG: type IV pilus biogenesis/stability protein PilW [Marinicella sp.]